jgi:HEPN domain-containing protein
MTWRRGQGEVEDQLAHGALELVSGAAADGSSLLASAESLLASASRELNANPEAAYVLAYDAARKSCASLLAQQGLRTKSSGHHVTTELVVRAQFGGPFDAFASLRRRRSEIEYPRYPGDTVTADEATQALDRARAIHEAASQLLPRLTLFRP